MKHSAHYKPEFDMRTPGERWHEEVENESPLLAFLTFALGIFVIIAAVIVFGSQPEASSVKTAYAFEVYEPEFSVDIQQTQEVQEEVEDEPVDEGMAETEVYVEEAYAYYEPTYDYVEPSYSTDTGNLKFNGVEYDGEYMYTWYSQNVLPGGGLDIPGRHVDDNGYVCDEDGNIVVASSNLGYGEVVETPYGSAKVYDTGYLADNQLDVYTAW